MRLILTAILLLAGVQLWGCGRSAPESEPVVRPVRYEEVYSTGSGRVRSFSGVAEAGVETNLSFKVSGTVRRLNVKVGDQVRAGQLIADLDPEDYELAVQDAEASLARSSAESRNAEANYERVRALYENNNASLNDLDGARAAFESGKAQVNSAEKRLELSQLQLSYTRLIAPVPGGISTVDVEVNENANQGQRIVLLTGGASIEVRISIPEAMITSIREGDPAQVQFDTMTGRDFTAIVTEVGLSATGGATTYPVVVKIQGDTGDARPGMAATVRFTFESASGRDSFLVPAQSVGEDSKGRFVYLVEKTDEGFGIARRKDVTVGQIGDQGLEILTGLQNGDLLVTAGVTRIRDGLRGEAPVNLTKLAIEKNRVTITALAVIIFAGISTFRGMPRAEDPGFVIRTAVVMTYFPGASPERVEMLVTDKLEKVIQEIPELDYVNSISRTGISQIMVNIKEEYTEMRPIWDDLRRKVDRAEGKLPDGVIGPFVDDEFGDVFGIVIGLTGEGYSYAELKDVADEVRDELLRIPVVAKVDIYGAQDERVFVEYNGARLAELGISPLQMRTLLRSRNIINPGGDVALGVQRLVLEPTGNFLSVDDLKRTLIEIPGTKKLVPLEDIARVYRGYIDPSETKMTSTGVPSLGLAISMQEGGNVIALGQAVKATLDRLQELYPIGIEFEIINFQPDKVEKKVNDFTGNLLQAVAIVLLVMLVTLGIRTGLVVAALVPVTMVMSFLIMSVFDIGLDQISLAALIIALGMLVDNAIVMSESIMVQISEGKTGTQAAIDSANELRTPLLISSLTTSAAFLPIFLAESSVGEYTASLFKVVTIALLSSWVLALTMTAMLCARYLKVQPAKTGDRFQGRWYSAYRRILLRALRRPLVTVGLAVVVFLLAMQGFRLVPNVFFPGNDAPVFTAELELPLGTRIERTEEVVREVEAFMAEKYLLDEHSAPDEEGITSWGTFIGKGGPRFYLAYSPEQVSSNYAFMLVNATSRAYIDRILPELEDWLTNTYPDLSPRLNALLLGPPVENPIEVRISGRGQEALFTLVEEVKAQLAETPGTKLIDDDWGPRIPKIMVRVNEARARRAGVTNEDVATSLQALLTGFETTEYREDDKVIPVTLRSVAAERYDIENLNIYSQATGQNVPILQVADPELVWQPAKILRRDRLKTVTVTSQLLDGFTAIAVVNVLDEKLGPASQAWPVGYSYEFGGELESSVKANQSIAAKLPIAGLIIILLLVGQFNSIMRPLIILLTIPLGLIGVVIGLIVANSYFGFMTLLGVVALTGIVINNAIVLLDRIKLEIEENELDPARAVVIAAQRRLRPIILTTMTTVGGLIPLWLGGGPMFEPMAIAILFGLLFATVLTLGMVPVFYALFFRVKFKDFEY